MNPIEELRHEIKSALEERAKNANPMTKEIIDQFMKDLGLKTGGK